MMRSYIVRKAQPITRSLKRGRSTQSDDGIRVSSIPERGSETSEKRSLFKTKHKHYSKSATKTAVPYENFIKEMKIRLPTPKQKFYQFLKIQPFNRTPNHNELIALFLKNVRFFKIHQPSLIVNLARKVRLVDLDEANEKLMIIVLQGQCFYEGQLYSPGQLLNRRVLRPSQISVDTSTKLLGISRHDYSSFLSTFISQQLDKFKSFINGIQLFKMFSQKIIQKFIQNLSLHFYLKGENIYKIGDEAELLYIIYSGKASRKVVVEIEKINKIPYRRFEREVRILSKTYSHQIEFQSEEIVGVTQLIDQVSTRKEEIGIDQDTIVLGIDRRIIEEHLDDYIIDRLKKYSLKKYPSSYDELCDNYQKQKQEMKRSQERKISAMRNELKILQSDKRAQKIEEIIKIYEQNIKLVEAKNLLSKKLHFEVDYTK